jgi:hypothetical protein
MLVKLTIGWSEINLKAGFYTMFLNYLKEINYLSDDIKGYEIDFYLKNMVI